MTHAIAKHRLGDITRFVSGGTPSKQDPRYWGGDTPWVSAKDLKSMHIGASIDTLSASGRDAASLVPRGTLLILVRGMTLFKSIPIGIASRELAINQDLKGLITNKNVSPEFLAYSLLTKESELLQMVEAAGHGTGRLDTDALKDVLVRVPSLPEQHQIASAIATWDASIQKTEQLIAAKERHYNHELSRLISRGQHPHTHVGNFAEEVSTRNRGGNEARVLSVTNSRGFVLPEDQFERRVASADLSNYKVVRRGQYAYNPSRINVGSIARLDGWNDGVLSPMYVVFRLDENKANSDYFLHWLNSHEARQRIKNSAQGSVRETVSFSEFAAITIPLPDKNTQTAIARYLNALREEINLLGQSVAALKAQKRGLMQKLLTGQWRLRVRHSEAITQPEEAHHG